MLELLRLVSQTRARARLLKGVERTVAAAAAGDIFSEALVYFGGILAPRDSER